ncbi:hypothetical protein HPB49_023404 [Dermacentor silvarum]|uniref:Uncharacterized protein n=1 Tax=Dermacentor silvarum TaxID=543639 RepID=A0ACB8CN73_DERSI|nr:hypothetical protein HPB49_023404 [Dermacentor silvarum]
MKEMVEAFAQFIRNDKLEIPSAGLEWPAYTAEHRQLIVLKPRNYSIMQTSKTEICDLWKRTVVASDKARSAVGLAVAVSRYKEKARRLQRRKHATIPRSTTTKKAGELDASEEEAARSEAFDISIVYDIAMGTVHFS